MTASDSIPRRLRLLPRWVASLSGRSYWHREQGMGQRFSVESLGGYFNDLTAKTNFRGPTGPTGLPLNRMPDGSVLHVPTTVLQYGLGAWDRWLLSSNPRWLDAARVAGVHAVATQDSAGGWPIWPLLGVRSASPYSAMTQGEGISLLARLYAIDHDACLLSAARRAALCMLRPIEREGTCRPSASGIVLEELPEDPPRTILNGWIFALYGLHDLTHAAPDGSAEEALESTINALGRLLPAFDTGSWSRYDLSGAIASPFYHRLHIVQLAALERTFPAVAAPAAMTRGRFETYLASRRRTVVAVGVKTWQKLAAPPEAVLQ